MAYKPSPHARILELTLISAEDLRINGKPIKNNAFVVVKTDSRNTYITKIDAKGDNYPTWNEKLHVDLPLCIDYINVEVYRRSSSGDRIIGMARVPVSDFIGDYTPENDLHFLSYRLRDAKGYRNGIVNLSVRSVTSSFHGCSTSSAQSELGIPVENKRERVEMVTGFPIWDHSINSRYAGT